MIAFHFPPLVGSSGIQRTLRFAQNLPAFGWRPVILAPTAGAYESADPASIAQIPEGCDVVRVPCLDAGRHLAIAGKYPGFLALPDRWASWSWLASSIGARACRHYGANALWSTFPIATAHRIGDRLATRTGLPWMADFRDPMVQDGYPSHPPRRQAFESIESACALHSSRMVFVSPSAQATYRTRYPNLPEDHFELIENGYDESVFVAAGDITPPPRAGRKLVILHSGIVYPSERDPTALMTALGRLKRAGSLRADEVVFRFRAPVHGELIMDLARQHSADDLVEVAPPVPYQQAVAEMMAADALMAMQADNCNEQIPAKVYEYVRAGRPILGLADPVGDTGKMLARLQRGPVVALESASDIEAALPGFIGRLFHQEPDEFSFSRDDSHSRLNRTRLLAASLDRMIDAPRRTLTR